jgi:hypothetical protein
MFYISYLDEDELTLYEKSWFNKSFGKQTLDDIIWIMAISLKLKFW